MPVHGELKVAATVSLSRTRVSYRPVPARCSTPTRRWRSCLCGVVRTHRVTAGKATQRCIVPPGTLICARPPRGGRPGGQVAVIGFLVAGSPMKSGIICATRHGGHRVVWHRCAGVGLPDEGYRLGEVVVGATAEAAEPVMTDTSAAVAASAVHLFRQCAGLQSFGSCFGTGSGGFRSAGRRAGSTAPGWVVTFVRNWCAVTHASIVSASQPHART